MGIVALVEQLRDINGLHIAHEIFFWTLRNATCTSAVLSMPLLSGAAAVKNVRNIFLVCPGLGSRDVLAIASVVAIQLNQDIVLSLIFCTSFLNG
ncbi:hypothetical protein KUH03_41055 [Sphingobacterium sp. E70]|uniref:hypothetical protein n=1 Tax=Sphingobacterium sp. E70 TaxID=2853439 RepID=UPI00211C6CE8|nr:hypothetical protein [Sphingobacterium sp. E70]ULT25158.1 hypothetical protein KUH03_41055 [Sphingobacterium sp. E70]